MTIGERIRCLRERLGITQAKLAQLSTMHPVSIRKYETNKMTPQKEQVERIAVALSISPSALLGIDSATMRLETYGDLTGMLMTLHNSNILIFDGNRDENNRIIPETAHIKISPLLKWALNSSINGENPPLTDILFAIKDKRILSDLLKWEGINRCVLKYNAMPNISKAEQNAVSELTTTKELIELELQRSSVMLDMENGIKVKIPVDFSQQS